MYISLGSTTYSIKNYLKVYEYMDIVLYISLSTLKHCDLMAKYLEFKKKHVWANKST